MYLKENLIITFWEFLLQIISKFLQIIKLLFVEISLYWYWPNMKMQSKIGKFQLWNAKFVMFDLRLAQISYK